MAKKKLPYKVIELPCKLRLHPPIHGPIIDAIARLETSGYSRASAIVYLLMNGVSEEVDAVEMIEEAQVEAMLNELMAGMF